MSKDLVAGIELAYAERTDLIVFALTGRTGSGCSTAAETLSKEFKDITASDENLVDPERRKFEISVDFLKKQWIPFSTITVSSVIYSFALDEDWIGIEKILADLKVPPVASEEFRRYLTLLKAAPGIAEFSRAMLGSANDSDKTAAWKFYKESIEPGSKELRKTLGSSYQPVFQLFGDNIRRSGRLTSSVVDPKQLFTLMRRVRSLVSSADTHQRLKKNRSTRVVIDAIRNPLELVYLRDHFAGLYAIAVTVDEETRHQRLMNNHGLGKAHIDKLDEKEYGEKKHLTDYSAFVSQNIRDCIQKADIFVANPGRPGQIAISIRAMNAQLLRYVALALRPGLVTPTRDERCMQIAFVAKLNSGCISRQVGAVVSDKSYSIQAIGWNDVPAGQVPCLLRDVGNLMSASDDIAFSEFEKHDQKLRSYLKETFNGSRTLRETQGLHCPYCFKDAYNKIRNDKNQVHTRSLHAEENAFLQLAKRGSTGIAGGVLYTTASPCELCSKKAYQLGMREVVFVDPYPGISGPHILSSGEQKSRPALRLFSGAIGHAYHRLYDALLPIKDEYRVRLLEVGPDLPASELHQESML